VLRSGDVPRVGSVQLLDHLDAEASTVIEEHGELGNGGRSTIRSAPAVGADRLTCQAPITADQGWGDGGVQAFISSRLAAFATQARL